MILKLPLDHFGSGRAVVHSMALFFVETSGCMEPGINGKERKSSRYLRKCCGKVVHSLSMFGSRDRSTSDHC